MADTGSGGYDGSIRIRTKLDNSEFQRGATELIGKINALSAKLHDLGQTKGVLALEKQLETLKASLIRVTESATGEKLKRNFTEAAEEAEKATAKAEELKKKMDESAARSKTGEPQAQYATAYAKAAEEAKRANDKLTDSENQLNAYIDTRKAKLNEIAAQYNMIAEQARQAEAAQSGGGTGAAEGARRAADETARHLTFAQKLKATLAGIGVGFTALASKARHAAGETRNIHKSMNAAGSATRSFYNMLVRTTKRILIFRLVHTIFQGIANRFRALIAQNAALERSLAQLKGSFLMAFQPLIDGVMPVLLTILRIATRVFKVIAAVIAALFGRTVQSAAASSAALDQEAASISGVGSAAKKASKSLANFDEINQLQNPDVGGGGGGGSLTGGGTIIPEYDTSGLERVYEWLERIKNSKAFQRLQAVWDRFKEHTLATLRRLKEATIDWLHNTDFTPLANSFARLFEKLEPLVELMEDGLAWAYENVLLPLATWAVEDLAPTFLNLLGTAIETLYLIIKDLEPYAKRFWEDFLQPLAKWAGDTVVKTLEDMDTALGKLNQFLSGEITWDELLNSLSDTEIALLGIGTALTAIYLGFKAAKIGAGLFSGGLALLTNPIAWVVIAIAALVAVIVLCIKHWDEMKEGAKRAWEDIKNTWGQLGAWFGEHVVGPIVKGFQQDIPAGIEAMKTAFSNLIRRMFNGVIASAETFLNNIIRKINNLLSLNIGGFTLGAQLPYVNIPRIPYLAQGAVIPPNAPFLAMLGDQTHGKNIEAPLDTLVAAFKAAQGEQRPQTVNIRFTGSLAQLGQVLKPVIEAENRRIGTSFASS